MAVDQLLGTLLFMYNMLNAQITTSFAILTSFRRVDEVTRTLEAKLAESRKQYEAARLHVPFHSAGERSRLQHGY